MTPRKFEFSLVNKEFDNLIAEHENKTYILPSNRAAVIHTHKKAELYNITYTEIQRGSLSAGSGSGCPRIRTGPGGRVKKTSSSPSIRKK